MFGANIDTMIIFKEPIRLVLAFPILCGFWVLSLLVNMLQYEIEYYNGAGNDYIRFGKETVERNYYTRLILRIPMEIEVAPCCLTKYWYVV